MGVVVAGAFSPEQKEGLELALSRAGETAAFVRHEDAHSFLTDLEQPVPRCILIDGRTAKVAPLVSVLRGEARLFTVPIILVVRGLTDQAFVDAHSSGADDAIVALDHAGLTRRVANLSQFDASARPPITQGRGLIAHADLTRRRVLGRVLRQAGFDLSFAANLDELKKALSSTGSPIKLAVVQEMIPQGGIFQRLPEIRASSEGHNLALIVVVAGHELQSGQVRANAFNLIRVGSELAPPDNLLFLANELLREGTTNVRASARLLYGTLCLFRQAGEFETIAGLTYNISREGMYIRTFDAPKAGSRVWIELRPPGMREAVHIRAKVVWARGLALGAGGAAPPGFGIRFDEGSCPPVDRAAYENAYDQLLEEPRHSALPL